MIKNKVEGRGMEGRRALLVWESLIKGIARGPKKNI
jgi:hypothetical protein